MSVFGWPKAKNVEARAEKAAKHMRFFRVFSERATFDELLPSASRAGFNVIHHNSLEKAASLQWATDSKPDFTFHISFEDKRSVSVIAESHGDIFGLVMTSHSNLPNISVETKSSLAPDGLGANAIRFRDTLLKLPDFDGGADDYLTALGIK